MTDHRLGLSLRLHVDSAIAIGPGKADLLEAIAATGSIAAAARAKRLSYRRAWQMLETMNACFAAPVAVTARGGEHGGGTMLTTLGLAVLADYRAMQACATAAAQPFAARILANLPAPSGEYS